MSGEALVALIAAVIGAVGMAFRAMFRAGKSDAMITHVDDQVDLLIREQSDFRSEVKSSMTALHDRMNGLDQRLSREEGRFEGVLKAVERMERNGNPK